MIDKAYNVTAASAREVLNKTPRADFGHDDEPLNLVAGLVTRAGPIPDSGVLRADLEVLVRVDLRPGFVGIEHELLHAAANGDSAIIREALADRPSTVGRALSDRAGSWTVPFGDDDDDRFRHFEGC